MLFYPAYSQVTFSGGNISGNNVSKNLDNNFNNYIITDSKAVDGMCDTNRISKVSSHLEYSNDFSLKGSYSPLPTSFFSKLFNESICSSGSSAVTSKFIRSV